MASD
jgi:hypothetical protein